MKRTQLKFLPATYGEFQWHVVMGLSMEVNILLVPFKEPAVK